MGQNCILSTDTLAITTIIFNTTKEIEATSLSLSQLFNHISSEKAWISVALQHASKKSFIQEKTMNVSYALWYIKTKKIICKIMLSLWNPVALHTLQFCLWLFPMVAKGQEISEANFLVLISSQRLFPLISALSF